MGRRGFCLAIATALACAACSSGDEGSDGGPRAARDDAVPVAVDTGVATGDLDERYIGVALDWDKGGAADEPLDGLWPDATERFTDEKLRNLVSAIAPSRLRIGGTDANSAYFCAVDPCEVPESFAASFRDADKEGRVFDRGDLERLADFAEAVDANVMFTVNLGPGPRGGPKGAWQADNFRQLLETVRSLPNGDRFDIWEAGNEVNVIFNELAMDALTPAEYVADLATLRTAVDDLAPGTQIAGPAAFFVPSAAGDFGYTEDVLAGGGREILDAVTWHLYAAQSPRCNPAVSPYPASAKSLFAPKAIALNQGFARAVRDAAGDLPVVNSESASAQCGGQFGVSDTQLDALWWADWVGLLVEEGTDAIMRQTLIGREYAILEQQTLAPHPTLLVNVLFRRTVTDHHLATKAERAEIIAHAYCGVGADDSVAAVLVNRDAEPRTAAVSLRDLDARDAEQWTVSADGGLTATSATINGVPAGDDGTVPDPAGESVVVEDGVAYPTVAPASVAFVTVRTDGEVTGCA